MQVERSIVINRDPSKVFELIDDPSRYPEFFVGITRWESRSQRKRGVGAKYRVLMRVGSIQAGGTVRVVRREPNRTIEWIGEQGIRQEGRWDIAPTEGGSRLTLFVRVDLSGGPLGALVARLAGRIVGRNLWATLLAARRILELEEPRRGSTSRSRR